MKKLAILLSLIALPLLGADCDKAPKKEKKGGCKTEVSQNLVSCLINAKGDAAVIACHKADQLRRCEVVAKKFKDDTLSKKCGEVTLKEIECLEKASKVSDCIKQKEKIDKK